MTSHEFVEHRDQRLRQPEREDELGSSHQELGRQTLKEASETLVLHHVRHDAESALRVLEVAVLNARLDHIERGRDNERCAGTGNRRDKVLSPGGLVVVRELVDVLLGKGRSSEKLAHRQQLRF